MSYILPQVQVFQEFGQLPQNVVANLNAFVVGPNYQLFRHSVDAEREMIGIGSYDPENDATYEYPNQPAGSTVDLAYVQLVMEYVWARYASIGASAATPWVCVSPVERNKLRAMPQVASVAALGTGMGLQAGGYVYDSPSIPESFYLVPVGGAVDGILTEVGEDDLLLAYLSYSEKQQGTIEVNATDNPLTEDVTLQGPYGLTLDIDAGTRKAAVLTYTGNLTAANVITLGAVGMTAVASPADPDEFQLGANAQATFQALADAVNGGAAPAVASCIHVPATADTGKIYFFGTTLFASTVTVTGAVASFAATAAATFNAVRKPVVLKVQSAGGSDYFTVTVDPDNLPAVIDAAADIADPLRLRFTSAGANDISLAGHSISVEYAAGVTLGELRILLAGETDAAALLDMGELVGDEDAAVDAIVDEVGAPVADDVFVAMVPDAWRIKVLPNDVTWATGNGHNHSLAFGTRGVRAGDRIVYTAVDEDGATVTGETQIAAIEADTVASVVLDPTADNFNAASAEGDQIDVGLDIIEAGADAQRAFDGADTMLYSLDAGKAYFPGDYTTGVLADTVLITITSGGAPGVARARVRTASGNYYRINVPIVASSLYGDATAAIYVGNNMFVAFEPGTGEDGIFQAGDTYTFTRAVQAPWTQISAATLSKSGTYAGPIDTTYVLEVTRGGVFNRTVTAIPGVKTAAGAVLTAAVDFEAEEWLGGELDDEYILRCSKAGSLADAEFSLSSLRGDNATLVEFGGSGSTYAEALGNHGLQAYFTADPAVTFAIGDEWVIRVNSTRPQITITDTAGIDQSTVVEVNDDELISLGLYGAVVTFRENANTEAGFASAGGLVLGDVFYVECRAPSAGALQTLVLADDLPANIVTGLNVDTSSSAPVYTTNHEPTLFSVDLHLVQSSNFVDSRKRQLPPNYNWTASASGVTVMQDIAVQDPSWTLIDGTMPYLPVHKADLLVQYRALLPTYSDTVYSLADIADVVTTLGTVHPDNPLAQGVFNALSNSGDQPVYFMSIPSDDLAGYSAAFDRVAKVDTVYGMCALSRDTQILNLLEAHVNAMSGPEEKRWRIGFVGTELPVLQAIYVAATHPTGAEYQATITDDPATPGANFTIVEFHGDGETVATADIRIGDKLRCRFATDAWGAATYSEHEVARVLSNTKVKLATGPAVPVNVAAKVEVWHPRSSAEIATAVAARSTGFANRRMYHVFPDTLYLAGQAQTSEFAAAALAGLVSSVPPQQGLTNIEVNGFDDVPAAYSIYNRQQLNEMAGSGTFIIMQDSAGAKVYVRHQVSTAAVDGNLLTTELSITKNLDAISYYFAGVLGPYIGRYNITDVLLDQLYAEVNSGLNFLGSDYTAAGLLGPMIILGENTVIRSLAQHPTLKDHVVIVLDLDLPVPLNVIQLRLVV